MICLSQILNYLILALQNIMQPTIFLCLCFFLHIFADLENPIRLLQCNLISVSVCSFVFYILQTQFKSVQKVRLAIRKKIRFLSKITTFQLIDNVSQNAVILIVEYNYSTFNFALYALCYRLFLTPISMIGRGLMPMIINFCLKLNRTKK